MELQFLRKNGVRGWMGGMHVRKGRDTKMEVGVRDYRGEQL
jgi:hypothetical protein